MSIFSFYGVDHMKPQGRAEFDLWYDAHKKTRFLCEEDLEKYCRIDCRILAAGCLKYRAETLLVSNCVTVCVKHFKIYHAFQCGIEAFSHVTKASVCMAIYKRNFLTSNVIGITPENGYRTDRQSVEALKYFGWRKHAFGEDITHAGNGVEVCDILVLSYFKCTYLQVRVGPYKVDGQLKSDPQQLFEYNGCVHHGCLCIKARHKKLPKSDLTAAEAYTKTMDRQKYLERQGWSDI